VPVRRIQRASAHLRACASASAWVWPTSTTDCSGALSLVRANHAIQWGPCASLRISNVPSFVVTVSAMTRIL
jgi:hypothetical protein